MSLFLDADLTVGPDGWVTRRAPSRHDLRGMLLRIGGRKPRPTLRFDDRGRPPAPGLPYVIVREEGLPGAPPTTTWHGPYDLSEQTIEFAGLVNALTANPDRRVEVFSVRRPFVVRSRR